MYVHGKCSFQSDCSPSQHKIYSAFFFCRNHSSVTSFILLGFTTDPKLQLLLFMMFTLPYVTTLVGNITLIMVIGRSSRLHTPMYFFIGNLSFLDLWYSSIYTPKILLNCVSEDKSISFAGCAAQFFVSGGLAYTEYTNVLSCDVTDNYLALLYVILTSNVILPSTLILASYASILAAILKMCSAEGKRKAFSTCAAHLTTVTLYYGSILFIYARPGSTYVLQRDKVVSVFYTVMIPMLNPFIYSLRNQEVKEALKRLVKRQTTS
uniref:Olfactory receptor family 9 subfamily G member 1 n=1 Tax=Aquila chrysaetos chrysaetos TaxID=223781 RepID=A0A663F510_AQUCH